MKAYQIDIQTTSSFGTGFDGDTLFGHFAWEIAEGGYAGLSIQTLLKTYDEKPFLIVSSIFPKVNESIVFPRPSVPLSILFSDLEPKNRKEIENKKYFLLSKDSLNFKDPIKNKDKFKALEELFPDGIQKQKTVSHNSINRITGTTGGNESFAPFSEREIFINSTVQFAFFVLTDSISLQEIKTMSERIGSFGYGRNATTGKGRFQVLSVKDWNPPHIDSANAFLTLGPSVEPSLKFYETFVRYGRHGRALSNSSHPFKNPILFTKAGAVGNLKTQQNFVGKGIRNVSKHKETVSQGFAPILQIALPEVSA